MTWASSKVGLQSLPCMPPCSPSWLEWWWLWASLEVTTDLIKREELCQAKPLNNCAELGCPPTSAPAQEYYLNKKQASRVTTYVEVSLIQVAFPDWYNGIGHFQGLCTPFHRTSARATGSIWGMQTHLGRSRDAGIRAALFFTIAASKKLAPRQTINCSHNVSPERLWLCCMTPGT